MHFSGSYVGTADRDRRRLFGTDAEKLLELVVSLLSDFDNLVIARFM